MDDMSPEKPLESAIHRARAVADARTANGGNPSISGRLRLNDLQALIDAALRLDEAERSLSHLVQDSCENALVPVSLLDHVKQALHAIAPDHPALTTYAPSRGVWESQRKQIEDLTRRVAAVERVMQGASLTLHRLKCGTPVTFLAAHIVMTDVNNDKGSGGTLVRETVAEVEAATQIAFTRAASATATSSSSVVADDSSNSSNSSATLEELHALDRVIQHFENDAIRFDQSRSVLCEGIGDALRKTAATIRALYHRLSQQRAASIFDPGSGEEHDG